MRIPDIELANISRYRGELMGAAMLFIILFHVELSRWDPFFGLRRMGNIGVDIFLVLMDEASRLAPVLPSSLSPHIPVVDYHSLFVLYSALPWRQPHVVGRPHWRHHRQLGLLASRRTYVLVYSCYHDALPFCTALYGVDQAPSGLSLAPCRHDYVVYSGAVGDTYPSRCGPFGDILESCSHLIYRHLDAFYYVRHVARIEHLFGAGSAWPVPVIYRAYALYPPHAYQHSDSEPRVPPHSPLV